MPTSPATLFPYAMRAPRRPRRWPLVVFPVIAVLAALVIAASLISVPYTELVPGDALNVEGFVSVHSPMARRSHGEVLLTDVGVNNLRLIGLIPAALDPSADLVRTSDLTGNLPTSEYDAEGVVDMLESQLTAKAVALRQLGYAVPERDVGVTVYVIDPGSPAASALQVGDVITSIDGTPTANPPALVAAVRSHRPGEVVTLRVGSILDPLPGRPVKVRLASTHENGNVVAFLGIGDPTSSVASMGTQPLYKLPVPITINSEGIDGPSAGLAFTLGIVNALAGGHITGGRVVAATGTIQPDGTVGDVGGVAQKTVAVERAGASVFFVPDVELPNALSEATRGLKVMGVASLAQALSDLEHLGGHLGRAALGPPPGPAGNSVPYDWQDSPWT